MISATKPTGEKYYKYILCYVDYLFCISYDSNRPMNDIQSILKFKNNKVETQDFYLGEMFKKKYLGGKEILKMFTTDYIKSAVENDEEQLKKKGYQLPSRAVTLFSQG